MEAYLWQWLQLGARWLHVVAGAAWIGTSFYFNWLNHRLRPPGAPRPGVSGELWSVHGGGFYRVEKYSIAPDRLPSHLHWFKWEAYATWLSGAALLVLIYYLESGYLLGSASEIGRGTAIGIGVATIAGGWLVYDLLCRSPLSRRPALLGAVLLAVVLAVGVGLPRVLSPRAAFIHLGAMIGTWMAANVFFVIIPGQRAMVRAMEAGRPPDPERGRRGALRSLHNNYLTLPVLFFMVSVHYPVVYASPRSWIVLLAVLLAGPAIRHFYNLRHSERPSAWLLPGAVAGLLLAAFLAAPSPDARSIAGTADPAGPGVADGVAEAILEARCAPCHSDRPTHPTAPVAPLGVVLDTPAQARNLGERVAAQVESGVMPLGNLTGMTPEERAVLLRWLRQEPFTGTGGDGRLGPDRPSFGGK
ncbi:MAG: urate hydroxylase PuuD [Gemmatimonadota bacterium]